MASIAEQIYDALNRSSAADDISECVQQKYCEQIARECIQNKQDLIAVLSKHPNWDSENYRVHFNKDFVRECDLEEAKEHLRQAMLTIIHWVNEEYSFCHTASTDEGLSKFIKLWIMASYICDRPSAFAVKSIDDYTEENLKCMRYTVYYKDGDVVYHFDDAHIHSGAKGTKQVMKLIRQYGFDNLPEDVKHDFLREYSLFADNMNPITITRHTVLSVNPVDFLYMSVGNSWTSCHNILQGGCYCGGCESYAYDRVSMIFYTVDAHTKDEAITVAPKINRQMNFFNGDALVSVRVYPQSCDGDSAMYDECKGAVQQILADCLGKPNLWRETPWVYTSEGYQYPDYRHFGPYTAYRLSDIEENDRRSWICLTPKKDSETGEILTYTSNFIIGSHDAICACCGGYLDNAEAPFCSECTGYDDDEDYRYCDDCGDRFWYEEMYWVGDCCYCSSCYDNNAFYCDCCGNDYFRDEGVWVEYEDRYICDGCIDSHYEVCAECGEYFYRDNMTQLANGDWACKECRDEYYHVCEDCGEYYPKEDCEYVEGEGYVCHDCLDSDYYFCNECNRWFKDSEEGKETADNGWVCDDCIDKYYEIRRKETR